ncbi:MAG: UpxY family transcription antiterminator [Rikenellaceae bacterium]
MIDYSDHGVVWYAMKTVYKKELLAKKYLDAHDVENFLPMVKDDSGRFGRKCEGLKPAIHNLIFIKTNLAKLNDIKISLNYLHNKLMTTEEGVSVPIIVPTKQMEQFIYAMTKLLDKITYIDLSTTKIEKGTPVRIIDGDFKGFEGELERVKGKRSRTVHVILQGIVGFKCEINACHIEKI